MSTRLEVRAIPVVASRNIGLAYSHPAGTHFTNRGAAGAVTLMLEPAGYGNKGHWYVVQLHADQSVIVAAATAGTLVAPGDVAADNVGFQVAGKKVGRRLFLFCDGTQWFAAPITPDGFCVDGVEVAPTAAKLTTPVVDGVTYSAFNERQMVVAVEPLTGADLHAGIVGWQNPEGADIIVLRAMIDLTTVATGACTLDVGVTTVSATTTSDTLLDGIDVNAATGLFDSGDAALDAAANTKAQIVPAGKWVTVDEKTGDATGLVANLIVVYIKR